MGLSARWSGKGERVGVRWYLDGVVGEGGGEALWPGATVRVGERVGVLGGVDCGWILGGVDCGWILGRGW